MAEILRIFKTQNRILVLHPQFWILADFLPKNGWTWLQFSKWFDIDKLIIEYLIGRNFRAIPRRAEKVRENKYIYYAHK